MVHEFEPLSGQKGAGNMKSQSIAEYVKLSVPERIQLVEDIWDSIAEVPEELPLTAAQQAELDRRLNAYRLNPEEGSPWEYIREAIRRS
jgi:putative addiction module component (TIGR02574 family)